jgi:hypothetical protein
MGYRSEVCMSIYGDSPQAMRELKAMIDAAGVDLNAHWADHDWGIDEKNFFFLVDDVKWYDSFPEVQAVMKIWNLAMDLNEEPEEGGAKFSGIFLRIGEDNTDVEEESFGDPWAYDPPYVSRAIVFGHKNNLGARLEVSKEPV